MRTVASMVLAVIVAFALPAAAGEHQGVVYAPLAGWQERVEPNSGARYLVPGDLAEGELLVVLLTPATAVGKGSLASQFAASVKAANGKAKVHARGKVDHKTDKGATVHVQMVHLTDQDVGEHRRMYAQVAIGKQKTFVTVVLQTTDTVFARYSSSVMTMLANLAFASPAANANASVTSAPPATARPAAATAIPTGETPDLFPGSVGWRPSGRGLAIPAPTLAGGVPRGLWWKPEATAAGLEPVVHIYLDGVRASNPRLGGGRLFDRDGQASARGTTGVGTFTVANGTITERHDGFVSSERFTSGKDKDGAFFKIGGATFRPLVALTPRTLAGEWKSSGVTYRFKADGSYDSTLGPGTWILDGYLLMIAPRQGASFITIAGIGGNMLVLGSGFYYRGR